MYDYEHPFLRLDTRDEAEYLFEDVSRHADSDDRLRLQVYVDGRLVDSWCGPVRGSRWAGIAGRHDAESRPPTPMPAQDPAHVRVLRWLDGLVGGRDALLALDAEPTPVVARPRIDDPEVAAAYDAVSEQLARVSGTFFDDEAGRVLATALRELWEADSVGVSRWPANHTAGGLVWLVGRANQLFVGGLSQTMVQRELWLKPTLSQCGQRLAPTLRGIDLYAAPRPHQCPDLKAFGSPGLLTAATRRLVVRWRDQALAASATTVLPTEVDFETGAERPPQSKEQ